MSDLIPFERYRGGHILTLPVLFCDRFPSRFMLDTGAGIAAVSDELCRRAGVRGNGRTYSGRRMSGQVVTAELADVPAIAAGSFRREGVVAGIYDLARFFGGDTSIEGILPAGFFLPYPYTINSVTRTVRVDRGEPYADRPKTPVEAPIFLKHDGPSLDLFLDLRLPNDRVIRVEVDTGSDSLILHSRYMSELGVNPERPGVERRQGRDETGYSYERYFTELRGRVSVAAAPTVGQNDPRVMFQELVHDGLVGDQFLRSFEVTYDLARSRLLFADPA
jgi:hypothetical protein